MVTLALVLFIYIIYQQKSHFTSYPDTEYTKWNSTICFCNGITKLGSNGFVVQLDLVFSLWNSNSITS